MTRRADAGETSDRLDLTIERTLDAPLQSVWQAWTEPQHLKRWWSPAPVTTVECEMDLRPGGVFRTLMRDPQGNEFPTNGAFLEVVPMERVVFTDAVQGGYRPSAEPFMTAIITMRRSPAGGTVYRAVVLHKDEADRDKHERMGFHDGWGSAIAQLEGVARELAGEA